MTHKDWLGFMPAWTVFVIFVGDWVTGGWSAVASIRPSLGSPMGGQAELRYKLISLPGHMPPSPQAGGPITTAAAAPTALHSPPRTAIPGHPAGRLWATESTLDVVVLWGRDLQTTYPQGWGAGLIEQQCISGWFTRAVLVPTWTWTRKTYGWPLPKGSPDLEWKLRPCEGWDFAL